MTMLKHILETKHAEDDFKCAMIVNDLAAINNQSDEVIAMQNLIW